MGLFDRLFSGSHPNPMAPVPSTYEQQNPQVQHVELSHTDKLKAATAQLAEYAAVVPPVALFPAFEMAETYRKILAESEQKLHRSLTDSVAYTLETALTTYLPNLYNAYSRTHRPTPEQTRELVQTLEQTQAEFDQALEAVRAGNSIDLESHTLFMRARMTA